MTHKALLVFACLLSFAACGRSDAPPAAQAPPVSSAPAAGAFRVTSIDLGASLAPDKRVAAPTTSFAASDTIYASVASEGSAPRIALAARWTYGDGQVVTESTETIAPTGPTVTEFHIARPSGWPAGNYRVEIIANGTSVGTREFSVR